jgi:hypothetical protein
MGQNACRGPTCQLCFIDDSPKTGSFCQSLFTTFYVTCHVPNGFLDTKTGLFNHPPGRSEAMAGRVDFMNETDALKDFHQKQHQEFARQGFKKNAKVPQCFEWNRDRVWVVFEDDT